MASGGYRPGAGKKPRAQPTESKAPSGLTPLEYMIWVIHDLNADNARRDRMAIAAAPFMHERHGEKTTKKEQRADAAKTAGDGSAWAELLRPN